MMDVRSAIPACPRRVTDANVRFDATLRGFDMDLKRWKMLKAFATNLSILGFAAFAIVEGADPTLVGASALVILGLLNGMEVSEFIDAWARISEAQARSQRQSENPDDQS